MKHLLFKKFFLLTCILFCLGAEANKDISQIGQKSFEITKVALDQKAFSPSKHEKVTLSFEVTKDADIQVGIYDVLGRTVHQFKMAKAEAGLQKIEWDGCDKKGKLATGKMFLYVIEAVDRYGVKAVYNPAEKTAGLEIKATDYTYDKKTGKIEYVLPKTCAVRIRAGIKQSVLVRTIMDWEPQVAGRHLLVWHGEDESQLLNIGKHPELELNLSCYTLPSNTILISEGDVPLDQDVQEGQRNKDIWARKGKYIHYTHDPYNCHEPRFTISFPGIGKINPEDTPILSGKVPIQVKIDPHDIRYTINNRFEIVFYVDGVFLFEVEEGSSPFTCHWNTHGLAKGPHVLTVNLMSYNDHIGTVSQKVIIGEESCSLNP